MYSFISAAFVVPPFLSHISRRKKWCSHLISARIRCSCRGGLCCGGDWSNSRMSLPGCKHRTQSRKTLLASLVNKRSHPCLCRQEWLSCVSFFLKDSRTCPFPQKKVITAWIAEDAFHLYKNKWISGGIVSLYGICLRVSTQAISIYSVPQSIQHDWCLVCVPLKPAGLGWLLCWCVWWKS